MLKSGIAGSWTEIKEEIVTLEVHSQQVDDVFTNAFEIENIGALKFQM